MNFDDIQKAWQRQDQNLQVHVDTQRLLRRVRRQDRKFRSELAWRDASEVGLAVLMSAYFTLKAIRGDWALLAPVAGCLFVAAFMLSDRWLQRRRRLRAGESLAAAIKSALQQVEHQIWLLENVCWWYLLPVFVGVATALGYYAWDLWPWGWLGSVALWGTAALCVYVFAGVYRTNQEAVRNELRPRQSELRELLNRLQHPEGD